MELEKFRLIYEFQVWQTPNEKAKRRKRIWQSKIYDFEMPNLAHAALYSLEFIKLMYPARFVKLEALNDVGC